LQQRTESPPATPVDARKQLAARLFGLGAIPILVFCAVYLLMAKTVGLATPTAQAWTLYVSLAGSVASLFLLTAFGSRALVGEVEAVRDAVRHVASGGDRPELPELTPPLEELKHEVLGLTQQFQGQHASMQQRLDTARQQIFFLTNHDPLTSLPNRRSLEERLESVIANAKSHGSTHALLYIDIDFFHRINDSFGHLAGDELLRRLVPVLQSTLRQGEVLARIGGDEFAVLLENCSTEFAQVAATQIRDAVQVWQFEWGGKAFQVGVSVGVVAISKLSPSLSAVMSEGDTACFTAKEQGRNRVFAFHDSHTSQYMRQTSRGWLKRINDAIAEGAFNLMYQPIMPLEGGEGRRHAARRGAVADERDRRRADHADVVHSRGRALRPHADHRPLGGRARLLGLPAPGQGARRHGAGGVLHQPLRPHALQPGVRRFMQDKLAQYGVRREVPVLRDHRDRCHRQRGARARAHRGAARPGRALPAGRLRLGPLVVQLPQALPRGRHQDRRPVREGVAKNYLDYALVESIHKIGVSLGLQTIAEYVESEDIARKLSQIGVTHGQGYWLSPPKTWETLFGQA
jgi:diguanylate cyclase (GGDEF)-like protein